MGGNRGIVLLVAIVGFGSLGFLEAVFMIGAFRAGAWFLAIPLAFGLWLTCTVAYKFIGNLNQPAPAMRKCTMCAEVVQPDALVCKHCGYRFPPAVVTG